MNVGPTKLWMRIIPTMPFVKLRTQIFFQHTISTWLDTVLWKKIFLLFFKCHSIVLNISLNWKVFYINICGFCNDVDRYRPFITHKTPSALGGGALCPRLRGPRPDAKLSPPPQITADTPNSENLEITLRAIMYFSSWFKVFQTSKKLGRRNP